MLRRNITEEDIRKVVDDEDIFTRYFGDFELNRTYSSKFRRDRNPSTSFYRNKSGTLEYIDYANDEILTSISFVMKLFGATYGRAIEIIASDFGIVQGQVREKSKAIKKYAPRKEKEIRVGVDSWKQHHLNYWNQYTITQKELEENNVYPVSKLVVDGKDITVCKDDVRFAYLIRDLKGDSYVKIYTPYSSDYKWVSNCNNKLPFGLYELPFKSNRLIISKSQKDRIILKRHFTDVIATQNESHSALDEEVITLINSNYDDVWINFDNDETGKKESKYYCDKYGWNSLSVPDIYYEKLAVKDISDLVKERGNEALYKFLKHAELV